MKLIIDDIRHLNLSGELRRVRTPNDAISALLESDFEEVWFDHDLGWGYYGNKLTLLDIWPVIEFLEARNEADDPIKIDKCVIHTSNPVGAQRLKLALDRMGYNTSIVNARDYL